MAKASLWKVPVLGKALAGSDQIPVERTGAGAGQASLELATKTLQQGRIVLIYPEGTVTRDPGYWPMKPRPGIGALALSGDFPVIPVAHWGSNQVYESYHEGRKFHPLPRKDVWTVFGEPIDLTELRSRPVDARSIRDASLLIMTVVRDMVAEIRGETPPVEFFDPKKAERLAKRAADAAEPRSGCGGRTRGRCEELTPFSPPIERVAVLGAGSWGTTYAKVLADAGRTVKLWARRESVAAGIRVDHRNHDYLPGVDLPESLSATSDFDEALEDVDAVVLGVPSQAMRENLRVFRDSLPARVPIVSLAKGVEIGTGLRMSEVIARVGQVDPARIVVLTGPNLAVEIALGRPTATVMACTDHERAYAVQVASATAVLPAVHHHRRGRRRDRRHRQEHRRAGLRHRRRARPRPEHLGLADHPRAQRGLPAGRRTRCFAGDLRRVGRAG